MAAIVNGLAPPAVAPPPPPPADAPEAQPFGVVMAEERDHLGRLRPSQRSSSYSRSRSRSYDYTGMDKAHEISQQAAAGDGALIDAAMNDPMSIPGLQNRIGAMQRYVNAYKSGQDLPDQVVLPARRLASESDSFSRSTSQGITRDKLGSSEAGLRPLPKSSEGAGADDGDKEAQFDDSGDGGDGGGRIQAEDAGFGPQGPPLPGLGGTKRSPLDDALDALPVGPGLDDRHGIPSLPVGKEKQSRDTEGARNLALAEDPTAILRRIQEEMGLV